MAATRKTVDPTRLARIVAVLTWIWFAADALLALSCFDTIYVLGGFGTPIASVERASLSDTVGGVCAAAFILAYVVLGIAALRWVYVVNRNAHGLGGNMTMSPGSNVFWFFLPIANLWKPFAVVRESWQATLNPSSPERVPVPTVMRYWWGAWLISSIGGNILGRVAQAAVTAEQIIRSNWLIALSTPIDLVLAVTFLTVVRRLSRLQSAALSRRAADLAMDATPALVVAEPQPR